jgi:uncharacterized protein (DUF1778 family)
MPKKKQPSKVRIQLQLDTDIAKALKMKAAGNLQTLTKFITSWVLSWKGKRK